MHIKTKKEITQIALEKAEAKLTDMLKDKKNHRKFITDAINEIDKLEIQMNISTLNKQYKLAKRYAVALSKLNDDSILKELYEIISALEENADLKNFLENKIIKIEDKKEIFEKVFIDINPKTKHFIFTLLDNKKVDYLYTIYFEYKKIIDTKNNIQEATIISAIELTEAEKAQIKAKLENKFKKEFTLF